MSHSDAPFVPVWTVHVTLVSSLGAPLAYGLDYGFVARDLAAVALVGVTYILYKWGQHRDPPSKYSDDDETRRREMEMEAEAGGYGGNM